MCASSVVRTSTTSSLTLIKYEPIATSLEQARWEKVKPPSFHPFWGMCICKKQIASLLMFFIKNFHVDTLLCEIRSGSQIRA
jgi:hypothetical protein